MKCNERVHSSFNSYGLAPCLVELSWFSFGVHLMTGSLLGLNWQRSSGISDVGIALLYGAFCPIFGFWRFYNRGRYKWLLYSYSLPGFIPPIHSPMMNFTFHIRYHRDSFVGPRRAQILFESFRSSQGGHCFLIVWRNDHPGFPHFYAGLGGECMTRIFSICSSLQLPNLERLYSFPLFSLGKLCLAPTSFAKHGIKTLLTFLTPLNLDLFASEYWRQSLYPTLSVFK